MKLTFKADQLASAVTWTARYAKPHSNTPILSGLLFEPLGNVDCESGEDVDAGSWTVTGFDYDHCATSVLRPHVYDGDGERFILHGRWLASLVAKLRGEVTLDVDDGVCTITSGRGRWTLPCMSTVDYPAMPEPPPVIGSLPAGDLRAALAKVEYATFNDATVLPELTMACLSTADGHLEVAATDKYRISRTLRSWFDKDQDPWLVDAAAFMQMLPDASDEATLLYEPDTLMTGIACGDRVLVSRGREAKFPKTQPFFDRPLPVVVTVRRDDLLEAIEQAAAGADVKTPMALAFDADNRSLTLEANDTHLSASSSVEIDAYATDTGWAAVKFEYLRDAVKTLDSEYVAFGLEAPVGTVRPIQLAGTNDAEATEWVPDTTHQQLIMPIRYER